MFQYDLYCLRNGSKVTRASLITLSYNSKITMKLIQFSSVQFSHSVVSDSATPWTAACQTSLSITSSRSSLRLTSIEWVMPSSHLILCHPLLLLPPILPSIRVFSNESTLHIRWPKYWSFSFSIIPSKEHPGQTGIKTIPMGKKCKKAKWLSGEAL